MLDVYKVQDKICKDAKLVERVNKCMDECIKLEKAKEVRVCIALHSFDADVAQYIYKELGFGF